MINRSNYDKIVSEFGIENLDPILKAQHSNYLEIQEFYNDDQEIKNTIDLYFRKLERFIYKYKQEESQKIIRKPAVKSKPSVDSNEKPKPKKSTSKKSINSAKQASKPKEVKKVASKKVEHFSEDRKFIKRFVGLHNKKKSKNAILGFIKALQKAIAQKLISKKSKFVEEVRQMQEALINYYNTMDKENTIVIPDKVLPRFVAIAGGEEVYKSIGIIKFYIGLQGKQPEGKRITSFIKQIENAIEKGKVANDDPYLGKVKEILKNLKKQEPQKEVHISKVELNGLEGILNACGCSSSLGKIYDTKGKPLRKCKNSTYSDARKGACSHNKGLAGLPAGVMTAEQVGKMKFQLLPFYGTWVDLFGKPEKNFSLMIHGEPGAGKSTFLIKLAKYLTNFGKVLYLSSEEFGSVTLTNLVNQYLNPFPQNLVFGQNQNADNLSNYDFVIFDSINDLGLKLEDYKVLKAENPNTALIFVLQHTKDGQFKGGKEWEHEAQIAATIENGSINVYKNRYGAKNSWYFFDN